MDAPRWTLPADPASADFAERVGRAEAAIARLAEQADALPPPPAPEWAEWLERAAELEDEATWLGHVGYCGMAADTSRPELARVAGRCASLHTRLARAWVRPEQLVAAADEAAARALAEAAPDHARWVEQVRAGRHLLLPGELGALAAELADPALHRWGQLYERLAGSLTWEEDGERVSLAQALARLDDPDAGVRRRAFEGIERACASVAETCALALDNIATARSVVCDRLGVDEIEEPLHRGRLSRATLDAVWATCREARPLVERALRAKARLLGARGGRVDWWDLRAPVGEAGARRSWEEGVAVVVDAFGAFSPEMAELARRAVAERWVDAEERPDKQHGAFCAALPHHRRSAVLLTWTGTPASLLTLAHELGHAYHDTVLWDVPAPLRRVPATLAETASTFAEALVRGRLMEAERDPAVRLALLEQEVGAAVTMLANIPVRFHFERAVYRMRRDGPLAPDALSAEMERQERAWYGEALGRAHPLFWVEKQHFYITAEPFYNFPYTFGFLFSALVAAHALERGPAWADGYRALLVDCGSRAAEAVAADHLGLRLDDPATWRPVLDRLERAVAEYERLAAG